MMKLFGAVAALALLGISPASANSYTVDFNIDPTDTVTGTIVTSCDNCWLDQSNIVSWSFMLNGSVGFSSSDPSASMDVGGHNLYASGQQLFYYTTTTIGNFNDTLFCVGTYIAGTCSNNGNQFIGLDFASGSSPSPYLWYLDYPAGVFVSTYSSADCDITSGASCFVTISLPPPASATPLPAALPLFATGLGVMGLLGWRRKRRAAAAAAS
jgi:hypothetical protein